MQGSGTAGHVRVGSKADLTGLKSSVSGSMSEKCQQATLDVWLEMKEATTEATSLRG
jgi:hypothetical protein